MFGGAERLVSTRTVRDSRRLGLRALANPVAAAGLDLAEDHSAERCRLTVVSTSAPRRSTSVSFEPGFAPGDVDLLDAAVGLEVRRPALGRGGGRAEAKRGAERQPERAEAAWRRPKTPCPALHHRERSQIQAAGAAAKSRINGDSGS